jgi:gluconate 2-dehydrogenase gamma chain
MTVNRLTRRGFLLGSARLAVVAGLASELSWISVLASCARDDARRHDGAFVTLTPREAATLRALAAQIIPSDEDGPGANEAGAVYFVDRALGLPFYSDKLPVMRAGLADLDARAHALNGHAHFASLTPGQQITVMRNIEHQAFFVTARTLVVIGTFADPSHGGNRDGAGWTIVGMEHRPSYTAPFGWYDAHLGAVTTPNAA